MSPAANVALVDERLEAIRRLHFRNSAGRCAECAATYPCATVRIIDPPESIWDQLKGPSPESRSVGADSTGEVVEAQSPVAMQALIPASVIQPGKADPEDGLPTSTDFVQCGWRLVTAAGSVSLRSDVDRPTVWGGRGHPIYVARFERVEQVGT